MSAMHVYEDSYNILDNVRYMIERSILQSLIELEII